jgi:hypothetical protein
VEELSKAASLNAPNVYVFRVSGSDDSNWGPDQGACPILGPTCVDDPRNFVPYAGNLYAYVPAALAGSSFSFTDISDSVFYAPSGAAGPYEHRFLATLGHDVEPLGGRPRAKAVTPGEVYYYRIRVVDNCWSDADRDGVEDSTAGTAEELTAWSIEDDFPTSDDWREAAVRISPFYPPMLNLADNQGNRDVPTDQSDDSDSYDSTNLAALDTFALPGYAIPQWVQGSTYVLPEKPTELYLSRANDSGSELLPADGVAQTQGVRVIFNAAKRSAPQDTAGASALDPEPVGYSWYRLVRKPVTYTPGTAVSLTDLDFGASDAGASVVTEFRLSADGLYDYTIDRRGEVLGGRNSAQSNSALDVDVSQTHAYRLFTAQVSDSTSPSLPAHVDDDGITPASAKLSLGSPPFLFPTPFYDHVEEISIRPDPPSGINAQEVRAEVTMDPTLMDPTCTEVKAARLLAYDYDSDQWLGSSDWITAPSGSCTVLVGTALVQQALRGYPDRARFRVELSDVDEPSNGGAAWDKIPRGARVRSDLVGAAGDYELGYTCGTDCGNNGSPAILGTVTETELFTEDADRVLVIPADVIGCPTLEDFSLLQVEAVLSTSAATMRSGTLRLPVPEFAGADPGGTGDWRYRWFEGSFCDAGGVCSFPVIDSDSTEIELRLRFASAVCDPVKLESFNFRVLIDLGAGAGLQELLCSNDASSTADAPGATDEPDFYCNATGGTAALACGRGPALSTEPCGQNPNCIPACIAGRCPANSNFTIEPTATLGPDPGDPTQADRLVGITQREDCSQSCSLSLTQVQARFECEPSQGSCGTWVPPSFLSANLVHEDGTSDPLPTPTISPGPDFLELSWSGLTGREVVPGESFTVELLFDGSMEFTKLTTWDLQFGSPLPAFASCSFATDILIPN